MFDGCECHRRKLVHLLSQAWRTMSRPLEASRVTPRVPARSFAAGTLQWLDDIRWLRMPSQENAAFAESSVSAVSRPLKASRDTTCGAGSRQRQDLLVQHHVGDRGRFDWALLRLGLARRASV